MLLGRERFVLWLVGETKRHSHFCDDLLAVALCHALKV